MRLYVNKGIRIVIIIMLVVVTTGIFVAYFYYDSINSAEDPRVIEAKYQYKEYNKFVKQNDISAVFATLDTIEMIYSQFDDYRQSYELGVVNNNRSAVWLTTALADISIDGIITSDLDSAEKYAVISIDIYLNWLQRFETLSEREISSIVKDYYKVEHKSFVTNNIDKVIGKRLDDIIKSKKETPRRLSVSYTNLAIVQRHKMNYEGAMTSYKKALTLWEGNRSAKNGINILLGYPVEEATILEKLFPEDEDL